ncbi:hypothetical protein WICPIJ_005814 [Wickerhamomyces pijperi]|uniref:SMC hinge domain-containing protein n=1 Tax=Wickerhamomyces pijperi TaxID=599730 RepID=A0A9P8Q353_WICPI|nr:hypothetical protein WICPIJ_005814 [Wickerhamomyces pijperi]
MRVEELIIDGFKSYATRTVISQWDAQFNAITGLNGSGKSNILDAICFVLGISSMSTVRASNLQDLIYKRGQAGVTKASVTIVFENSDKEKSPIGFEDMAQISVTRQIVLGGTSKYLINGHRAQQQTVLQLFQSVQLNINNPNFLIMQGKITKVLNMKPAEILSLIEEAAGTKMYEIQRERAEKTIEKKEHKLVEIRNLLAEEIEPKLEKLRTDKRIFLEYQQDQTDVENLTRIHNAHSYKVWNDRYLSIKERFDELNSELSSSSDLIDRLASEVNNLNDDLETTKAKKQNISAKSNNLKSLEAEQTEISKEITRLNTTKSITSDNLNDEMRKRDTLAKQIAEIESTIAQSKSKFSQMEEESKSAQVKLDSLKKSHTSKEELLSTLTTGMSDTGSSGGYQAQLSNLKNRLSQINVNIQQHQMKIQHLTQENKTIEPSLIQAETQHQTFMKEIESLQARRTQLTTQMGNVGYSPDMVQQMRKKEAELSSRIQSLSSEANHLKRQVANMEFNYSKPSPNFDTRTVKGVVAKLFQVPDENTQSITALEVTAGGRLYNVVVDNEMVGTQLLEKGQLRRRVTIIPLNKINAWSIPQRSVDLAKELFPNKVESALNLIGFEQEVSKAMEYIFGQTLICQDADTASKVTYNKQIGARSVTLEGDVYNPDGTLSGGSRKSNSSTLANIQKYNNLEYELSELKQEITSVRSEISRLNSLGEQTRTIQNDLNLVDHQIQLAQKNLNSNQSSKIMAKFEGNKKEIEDLSLEVSNYEREREEISDGIVKTEKDISEFSSNKDSKLDELKLEVARTIKEIKKLEQHVSNKSEQFQTFQIELDQVNNDLLSSKEQLAQLNASLQDLNGKMEGLQDQISAQQQRYEEVSTKVDEERSNQMGIDEEIAELTRSIKERSKQMNDTKLKQQKVQHELEKFDSNKNNIEQHLKDLLEENPWLEDDNIVTATLEEQSDVDLNNLSDRIERLNERLDAMKRKVNPNVMNTIDNVERKEAHLKQMVRTIEKDKTKIQNTIVTLNEHKKEALIKTSEKVSTDFGQIFSDLLPNSFCKLDPPEGQDVTQGLEVKVQLGKVWKESLVELSGGQRSLIALSLILALLQFKPAPMYILDEVDAALDLSHTQNIGHLIKTRFKGSQFIIVSLKEGMFTNANRVFRTRFQDGTSVVSIM